MQDKAIEIKNLNYTYPDGTVALRNINLDIFSGETVGIIGPNGAGKTTLLLHLNGILRGEGKVKILDLEMEDKNLPLVRSKLGLVFQDPENQLFMPTVFDDISFGPINMMLSAEEVEARVNQALEEVGMSGAAKRPSHHLSFGEKKKVSIATVLSMQPQILVLDEPTSNLDPKARRGIINLLKNIGQTKVIASHDLEMLAELCSQFIFLDKGTILASDTSPESLNRLFLD